MWCVCNCTLAPFSCLKIDFFLRRIWSGTNFVVSLQPKSKF